MALSVNTNIASLNAQRNLTKSGSDLGVSLQRLSTGLRINSAKDDAAGLAISERFTTQIRGMNVAIRNSNDGISLAQTAEGALGGLSDSLQRIRELAVQSANATNSASDRQALQDEVSQLLLEIDRVARETSFNGVNLLDGSFISQQFQVGANAGQTITVDAIANARLTALGETFAASATGAAAVDTNAFDGTNFTINGTNVTASLDDNSGSVASTASAKAKAAAINNSNISGVSATAGTTTNAAAGAAAVGAIDGVTDQIIVNGVNIGIVAAGANVAEQGQNLAAAIDALDGISATDDGAGTVTATAADGRNLSIEANTAAAATASGFAQAVTTTSASLTVDSTTSDGLAFVGTQALVGTLADTLATSTIGIDQLTIADVAGANTALAAVDSALGTLNSARATLGAVQSRFETVISNLSITSENLTASRGRILDADFAAETANLTKTQILQQAGVAILAQANGLPQLALSLLQ